MEDRKDNEDHQPDSQPSVATGILWFKKKKRFLIIATSSYKGKEMSYKGRLRGSMEKG
jgi:hypothetical protein